MGIRCWFAGSICVLCLACSSEGNRVPPPQPFIEDPESEFPERLSGVGLWDLSKPLEVWSSEANPHALEFEPHFPLWTNGARKRRQLVLPQGELIDASDPTSWKVPAGSIAFKTLFFANASGEPVPAETRVIQLGAGGERRYAVYVWDPLSRDATRVESGTTLEVRDFRGNVLTHEVPSEGDCSACHDSSPQAFLGLNSYQQQVEDAGTLSPQAFAHPPAKPERSLRGDDEESRALGYLVGNCSHCHNDWRGPNSEFSLLPEDAVANLVNVESTGSASVAGIRVIPGDPDNSLLLLAMNSVAGRRLAKPMPPLGVQREDDAGMHTIAEWIEQLDDN
ncbi:MAG: hypothetical protein H6718_22295 [Polyangiaceae bacterium]|nr:hypothetical protein [Polyangiaceae bacterium]